RLQVLVGANVPAHEADDLARALRLVGDGLREAGRLLRRDLAADLDEVLRGQQDRREGRAELLRHRADGAAEDPPPLVALPRGAEVSRALHVADEEEADEGGEGGEGDDGADALHRRGAERGGRERQRIGEAEEAGRDECERGDADGYAGAAEEPGED